ncbi:MAG: family 78 glycoside hydrolase catalytic domain [Ignavibacteriales bacterium]|nr:family 78 glycoside hydrolase catalytic domain [Ignavibacteriales bacterium]
MNSIKKKLSIVIISFLIQITLFNTFSYSQDKLLITNPRVEYKTNPIGIDELKPRFSWEIISDKKNILQTKFEIVFSNDENNFDSQQKSWEIIKESDQSIHVEYEGPELQSRQRVYWKVRVWDNHDRISDWSEVSFWEMGLLNSGDWKAEFVQANITEDIKKSQPAQYFRKEFETAKKIKNARLYITSHGLYEAYINGEKVGDQVFTPGWTSYNKRLQYQTYDITNMIKDQNAIGVILGDGWYRGYLAWNDNRNVYGEKLAVLAQIEIEYSDGSKSIVNTDETWEATNNGPIIKSDIYMGEKYDARKELTGWNTFGYDESWEKTSVKYFDKNNLVASEGPAVRKIQEVNPVKIIPKDNGKYIFDMGQNMVGRIRLNVKGESGRIITLRHAEVLDKYGNFYTENLRVAKQEINYTLKSNEIETYEPYFTFQGFRYVEVSNFPGEPNLESITGIVIHSDMTPTGNFSCSDPLINQLQSNIQWGLKGNFLDVPTDCPQRDERLGWTGDAQVFAPTACFNVDAAMFYTKWLKDLSADQDSTGKVGDVIPNILNNGGGHTGWADAAIVVPWTVYQKYGDVRILQNQYESMKEWIGYMENRAGNDFLWDNDWHYGDWLSFDASSASYMGAYTETDLIATAYFSYSSNLVSKISKILGKQNEAEYYAELSKNINKAFLNEFVTNSGRLVSNTQTAYTLALAFNLLPEDVAQKAVKYLAQNVERFKHITTGFLGTPLISKTLTENGRIDLAYMLLTRKNYPSWLYPVTMGATTIWERWDGMKPDSTFQDKGMNSFNHYAYGAIGDWLYSTVAGIKMDESDPGYKSIIINPNPGGDLTFAEASYNSMYGKIKTHWQLKDNSMELNITVPPNTTAYVLFDSEKNIILDGNEVTQSMLEKYEGNNSRIKIGSGSYKFVYNITK